MTAALPRVLHGAAFPDYGYLYLARVHQGLLYLLDDFAGHLGGGHVVYLLGLHHYADFAPGLYGEALFHAVEGAPDLFQGLQPLDVVLHGVSAGAGPGPR